jgi:transposase-like protein
MQERGADVDASTIFRWVRCYAPELEKHVRLYQGYRSGSWRVDETYVRVNGKWKYLFRAVDEHAELIDFTLLDRRDTEAAYRLLGKALKNDAALAATFDHYRQTWLISEGHSSAAARGQAQ